MLKRTCSVFLLVIILVTAVGTVFAIEQFPGADRDIPGFSLNASTSMKSGNIYANGEVTTALNGYTIKVTPVLQKKTSSGWTKVNTTSGGSGKSAYAYCKYAPGTYRAKVSCTVTNNATQEKFTLTTVYSKAKDY